MRLDQDEELGLSGITNEEEKKLARKMLVVSFWCIQNHPSDRPSMTNVVEMLEGKLRLCKCLQSPSYIPPQEHQHQDQQLI